MQNEIRLLSVCLVSLLSIGATSSVSADTGRECKGEKIVRTGGTAQTEFWARKRARDAWRQKTEEKFGKKWSAWYVAKDHDYTCFKESGKDRCTAKATPCRSTIVVQGPRKVCGFYMINATGESAQLEEWAKHKARKMWSERARMLVGDDFDTWLLASNRSVECKGTGNGREICTAKAKPCRFSIIN